ncbi:MULTISPECIES: cysteine hydrolase family protein [Pontibacillus]|uniref:Isochorismatase family cysteine hydrolase n=1 Tax=Pontibacillus chungwhensis TaxID=265426 RepID=A0ABY8UWG1_9BACI|nr:MULTISPECIES: isochorismatase family cysteine hydrolase [Pontibacillus]MCD5325081.1 cysteine hydrolase [Pontibacillus sp. HN14]WIF97332.1 isochorismatase family cysteine hydrolase [Pontibacillus chungwhensis]
MSQHDTALLLIDMVNKMDFDGGEHLLDNTLEIIPSIQKLKQQAKAQGIPVIYVNDNFGLWQENVSDLIEECRDGRGEPVIRQILPEDDDYFIIKPKHSGFFGTQLSILLDQLGVNNLILTGIAGDICVLFTANDAYMREYNIWIPADCVASEYEEDNENAIRIMERSLSANTTQADKMSISEAFST